MKIQVVPSILNCDFSRLGEEIKAVDAFVDRYQLDVMDGHYVPNLSFGFPILEAMRKLTDKPLEADLMISNPDEFAGKYAQAGADYVIVHVEATKDIPGTFAAIREAGGKPGISLNPKTSAEDIKPYLADVSMVIVMTVEPGFGGQAFLGEQLEKVKIIREWITEKGLDVDIEVDGGVNAETAKKAVEAGANLLVAGSYIYKSSDYEKSIASLK